jgi:phosphate starvation-inducible PhoH-like protein
MSIVDEDELYGSSDNSSIDMAMTYPLSITHKYSSSITSTLSYKEKERVKPRNPKQADYMNLLESVNPAIVLAVGSAGTGKTMIACHIGLRKLVNGDITKLILTRPAVSVEEQHGFLPGTLEEKMEPWLKPIYDIMYQYFTVTKVQQLIKNQVIEICPLAYMRGRTFEHAWIIADEAQNMTPNQMLMLLTRIGHKSKMIITGDPVQHDRGFEVNGLNDLIRRMKYYKESKIGMVEFTDEDVERHPIIKSVLKMYKHKTLPIKGDRMDSNEIEEDNRYKKEKTPTDLITNHQEVIVKQTEDVHIDTDTITDTLDSYEPVIGELELDNDPLPYIE